MPPGPQLLGFCSSAFCPTTGMWEGCWVDSVEILDCIYPEQCWHITKGAGKMHPKMWEFEAEVSWLQVFWSMLENYIDESRMEGQRSTGLHEARAWDLQTAENSDYDGSHGGANIMELEVKSWGASGQRNGELQLSSEVASQEALRGLLWET